MFVIQAKHEQVGKKKKWIKCLNVLYSKDELWVWVEHEFDLSPAYIHSFVRFVQVYQTNRLGILCDIIDQI